ncbi:PREDICTED: uncharacterized protein LOC108373526 [Rhagoletis zephyria]|uniref:uncharacterized protein LOC108373526 n=1 Tax=Rhagoletis zephyria TaxID=28612 RepID=UPI0008112463|nr:PREDICTED: uncharacterized protein LOC108373526 [Rhagoletis zephyria]
MQTGMSSQRRPTKSLIKEDSPIRQTETLRYSPSLFVVQLINIFHKPTPVKKDPFIGGVPSSPHFDWKRFRKAAKSAKAQCFQQFSSTINRDTPIAKVWSQLKTIYNRNTDNSILSIKSNNQTLLDPSNIANQFASDWAQFSSDDNFSPAFRAAKYRTSVPLTHNPSNMQARMLESAITTSEFKQAINGAGIMEDHTIKPTAGRRPVTGSGRDMSEERI